MNDSIRRPIPTSVCNTEYDTPDQDLNWTLGRSLEYDSHDRDIAAQDDCPTSSKSPAQRGNNSKTNNVTQKDTCSDESDVSRVCRIADRFQEIRVGEDTTNNTFTIIVVSGGWELGIT